MVDMSFYIRSVYPGSVIPVVPSRLENWMSATHPVWSGGVKSLLCSDQSVPETTSLPSKLTPLTLH